MSKTISALSVLALGFSFIYSPAVRADALDKGLMCQVKSQYLDIAGTVAIDLSEGSAVDQRLSRRSGEKVLSWSESECEDSTEVRFSGEDFEKISKGQLKKIHGSLKHEEADGKIELRSRVLGRSTEITAQSKFIRALALSCSASQD